METNGDKICAFFAQVQSLSGGWRTLDTYSPSEEARAIARIHSRCAVGFPKEKTRVVAVYEDETREVRYRKTSPPVDEPENDDQFIWRDKKET